MLNKLLNLFFFYLIKKDILVYIQLLEVRSENENLKSLLESEQKSSKQKYNELKDKLQVQFKVIHNGLFYLLISVYGNNYIFGKMFCKPIKHQS